MSTINNSNYADEEASSQIIMMLVSAML